jgi:iron complex outermembrane receptor protein
MGAFMGQIASTAALFGLAFVAPFRLDAQPTPIAAATNGDTVERTGEIIVTARRRAERPQRVPISLSIIDGKAIEAQDIRNTTDLSARAPNLLAPPNAVAISTPTFYIRGVGEGDHNWNDENGVAFFIDDVYIQSPSAAWLDFTDMDRVEVLRGPQGTLYGRNSTSGAIKFVPRQADPSKIESYAETTLGGGGRIDLKAGANLPLAKGDGAIRFNLFDVRSDGSLTEVDSANRSIDDRLGRIHHSGARIATLWRPRDGLEFELNGDIERQHDGIFVATPIVPDDPAGLSDPRQLLSKEGTVDFDPLYGPRRVALEPLTVGGDTGLLGGGVVLKARLDTPLGRLSSISSWRDYNLHYNSQLGGRGTPSTFFGVTLYGNANTHYETSSQITQELQLIGKWRSLVDYTAGIFFFHDRWRESEYGATNGIPANLSPFLIPGQTQPFGGSYNDIDQTTNSYAVYGSADLHLTPALTVSAGGRQTWDHKGLYFETLFEDHVHDYPGFPLTTSKAWSRFTPRLGVDWKPSSAVMLYASWAKGYKVGNVEGARSADPATAGHWLGPEIATTVEAGAKLDGMDHRLIADVDAFTSLNVGRTDLVSPDRVASSTVRSKGIEAEFSLQPTNDLNLHAALGLLWAKYLQLSANHPALLPDANGFILGFAADPPMTPRYTLSADAHYRAGIGSRGALVADASVLAVGKHFHPLGLNNYDSEIVRPYAVVDASVGWISADNRIQVTIGAHNILDKLYWTTGMFGSIPEFAGRYYADPRRIYVELRFSR